MPLRKTTTDAFGHFLVFWCLAASAQTTGSDGPLSATLLDQIPEPLPIGVSVTYRISIENTDTAGGGVGAGVSVYVDGMLQRANSGVFTSGGCIVDAAFPEAWACSNLTAAVPKQTFTLTWVSPGPGLHIIRFEVIGQRQIDNIGGPDFIVSLLTQTQQIGGPSAGLVERDLIFPGDGLVSFDESTGFEWLDLTATLGLGVTDIKGGDGGWVEDGWRHATEEEVRVMWSSLGITHRELPQDDYGELEAVNRFFDLFGLLETDPNNGLRSSQGWTDLTINNQFYAAAVSSFDDLTFADTSNLSSASGRNSSFGNYLVREQVTVALADGPYEVFEGSLLVAAVNILDNDRDPEGDQLTPIVVDPPVHASFFQVMPDGTFDYTHDGSETTSDLFTYRASDGVNESQIATVLFEITPVNDAPRVQLIGQSTISIDRGAAYTDPGASAEDPEDGDISDTIVVGGDVVDTNVEGTYLLTYNVTDSHGLAADEVIRTVIVTVDEPPVITLIGPATLNLQVGGTYNDQGATAVDPEDGDLTNAIVIDNPVDTSTPGTYTVTYSVVDSTGNQAQAQRTIIVAAAPPPPPVDQAPTITLNGAATFRLIEGDSYSDAGATASDPEDGDLTAQIVVNNSVDTGTPGTYTVTYTVEDSGGNQARSERTVIVEAAPSPPPTQTDRGGGGGGGAVSLFELLVSTLILSVIGRNRQRSDCGRRCVCGWRYRFRPDRR